MGINLAAKSEQANALKLGPLEDGCTCLENVYIL